MARRSAPYRGAPEIVELIIQPEAEEDLGRSFEWYEGQRPGLGIEFFDEVTAAFARIRAYPLAYARIEATIRRALTRRFPFAIYFEPREAIRVIAVLHQMQNPFTWQKRIAR